MTVGELRNKLQYLSDDKVSQIKDIIEEYLSQ